MKIKLKNTSVLISRTFFLKLRIRDFAFFLLLKYLVASPIWNAFFFKYSSAVNQVEYDGLLMDLSQLS